MKTRFFGVLLAGLIVTLSSEAASEPQYIKLADFASGKTQIVGALGVPIGHVVRVDAVVVSADKAWPDSGVFRGRYLLSIHTIDGRTVRELLIPFGVHTFAVSKLFPSRSELREKLRVILKRDPTEPEITTAEAELLTAKGRSFLVYEWISFSGYPSNVPADVITWDSTLFGPFSGVDVIKELETKKEGE